MTKRLGIIADTHDYFDPQLAALLQGVDLILHAGDVGERAILHQLSKLAPVCAVRGNIDEGAACNHLPDTLMCTVDQVTIYMTHIFAPPTAAEPGDNPCGGQVVLFGHTHQQHLEEHGGVLYFNPARSGRTSSKEPRSVGLLEIRDGRIEARHLTLE
jgi:putative phosphoesterase